MKQNKQANLAELLRPEPQTFEVMSSPINTAFKVTIDDNFTDVRQFAQIVDVLDAAQEGDFMQIKLSTNGGALHSIVPLINAIRNTEAHVHVFVESDTASAGTMLMMVADSVYVNEYANIMLHTAQYGYGGHSGNMDAHVTYSTKQIEKLVRDVYTDWLDEDEILRLLDGKEFWFDAEECMERFSIREEIWAEREQEEEQPSVEEIEAIMARAKESIAVAQTTEE